MRRFQFIGWAFVVGICFCFSRATYGLEKLDTIYKVFQFPANQIPRIDGDASDWSIVPDDYVIGTDQVARDNWSGQKPDPAHLDFKMKIGWVKGMNRLYFLYEATKDYWDFDTPALRNDILELAVDGDRSGGPFVARFHPATQPGSQVSGNNVGPPEVPLSENYVGLREAWYHFQGTTAQNYHIFTPAQGKDWCMAWGPQAEWIKKLPYSNVAYNYSFKSGQGGKLIMELMITPFDYAGAEGPARAVESELYENKIIGMGWAIIDIAGANGRQNFWNLSPKHTMYGQASELCAFKLMPLEPKFQKPIDAQWSFKVVDIDRKIVAFHDDSIGKITSWKWDFGDDTTSTEQNPIHTYAKTGSFVVTLYIEGPAGQSRLCKVWDVTLH